MTTTFEKLQGGRSRGAGDDGVAPWLIGAAFLAMAVTVVRQIIVAPGIASGGDEAAMSQTLVALAWAVGASLVAWLVLFRLRKPPSFAAAASRYVVLFAPAAVAAVFMLHLGSREADQKLVAATIGRLYADQAAIQARFDADPALKRLEEIMTPQAMRSRADVARARTEVAQAKAALLHYREESRAVVRNGREQLSALKVTKSIKMPMIDDYDAGVALGRKKLEGLNRYQDDYFETMESTLGFLAARPWTRQGENFAFYTGYDVNDFNYLRGRLQWAIDGQKTALTDVKIAQAQARAEFEREFGGKAKVTKGSR